MRTTAVNTRRRTRLPTGLLVALLLAGACGGAGDDPVATVSLTEAPTQAGQAAAPPPTPPEPPSPSPAEQPPELPAGSAEPAAEPVDSPAAPPAETESRALPQGELDEAAVTALAARIIEAQSNVTSWQARTFMSVRLGFRGDSGIAIPGIAIDDVLTGSLTRVGDLVRIESNMAGILAETLVDAEDEVRRELANLPPLEVVMGSAMEAYVKLGPLLALRDLDPPTPPQWMADLVAEHGDDLGDLWVLLDLTDHIDEEVLAELGLQSQSALEDFIELIVLSSAEGALLEARSGGRSQVAGAEAQEYLFVLDLAAMAEFPSVLEGLLGEDSGQAGPPLDGFLGGLSGPVPVDLTVHIDENHLIRRVVVDFDVGRVLAALFNEPSRTDGVAGVDQIEGLFSARLETVAVNDPSLSVTLPDPSLVVPLP